MEDLIVLICWCFLGETYLHRIGRTGRFGKHGLAINLVDGPKSMAVLKEIERHFGKDIIKLDAEVSLIIHLEPSFKTKLTFFRMLMKLKSLLKIENKPRRSFVPFYIIKHVLCFTWYIIFLYYSEIHCRCELNIQI